MKMINSLLKLTSMCIALASPKVVWAQSATPSTVSTSSTSSGGSPAVIVRNYEDKDLLKDLKGAPPAVAAMIINFDNQADKYLLKQRLLLEKLSHATTEDQREAIRDRLQDNRQAFLDQLADFREKLKDDLQDLKGRISNAEFLRIIDAAKDASELGHFRRGH